jgi:predicted transcriptional regulator
MAGAEELVGYISGNVRRRQTVEALSKGGESLEQLEKLTRIPRLMLEKIIKEMAEKKIVQKTKGGYKLTDEGEHVAHLLKSMH